MNEVLEGFLVMRYLLGARGAELLEGLDANSPEQSRALGKALAVPDQRPRAHALTGPLRRLLAALDARQVEARYGS